MSPVKRIVALLALFLAIGWPSAAWPQARAPKGGIYVNGKFYKGGQFLPREASFFGSGSSGTSYRSSARTTSRSSSRTTYSPPLPLTSTGTASSSRQTSPPSGLPPLSVVEESIRQQEEAQAARLAEAEKAEAEKKAAEERVLATARKRESDRLRAATELRMARIFDRSGKREVAIKHYRNAAQLDPGGETGALAISRLVSMGVDPPDPVPNQPLPEPTAPSLAPRPTQVASAAPNPAADAGDVVPPKPNELIAVETRRVQLLRQGKVVAVDQVIYHSGACPARGEGSRLVLAAEVPDGAIACEKCRAVAR